MFRPSKSVDPITHATPTVRNLSTHSLISSGVSLDQADVSFLGYGHMRNHSLQLFSMHDNLAGLRPIPPFLGFARTALLRFRFFWNRIPSLQFVVPTILDGF